MEGEVKESLVTNYPEHGLLYLIIFKNTNISQQEKHTVQYIRTITTKKQNR